MVTPISVQFLLHLLQMILLDYPEAVLRGRIHLRGEYREIQELCERALVVSETLPPPHIKSLPISLVELKDLIQKRESFLKIRKIIRLLEKDIKDQWPFTIVQPKDVDLAGSQKLFQDSCAACHGMQGDGRGPASTRMDPKPTDFVKAGELDGVTGPQLFNIIRFGLPGTAMPSFESLSETQIWKLVFYIRSLNTSNH